MMLIYPADVTAPPGPRPDPVDALMDAWHTELPDVLRPTTELSKRIAQLARALDQATRGVLPELGLTVAEFDILVALRRAGEPYRMKPNELARVPAALLRRHQQRRQPPRRPRPRPPRALTGRRPEHHDQPDAGGGADR